MAYEAMNNAGALDIAADRHPQRQRHVDRAAGRRAVATIWRGWSPARTYPSLRDIGQAARASAAEGARRTARAARRGICPRHGRPAARCSRSSASTTSARSTATISTHLLPVLKNVRDAEHGPDPGPCRDQEGQGLRAGREVRRQISRRGQVRRRHRRAGQGRSRTRRPTPKVFAESADQGGAKDDKIVAITAAMPSGTGLDKFGKALPRAHLRRRHRRAACA